MMTLLVNGKSQVSEFFGDRNSPFKVTGLMLGNYHYAIEYGTGMNSPCLGSDKRNGGIDIGMIEPRVICIAS
jgi:hypothetical protein